MVMRTHHACCADGYWPETIKAKRARRKGCEAKTGRARFRAKLFWSSTDREAKELFFLERFTFFQQGRYRETATLTTQRHFAVELLQKSKQHFA
jgi:hypothetical protein